MNEAIVRITDKRQHESDVIEIIGRTVKTIDVWLEDQLKKVIPAGVYLDAKNGNFFAVKQWLDTNNVVIHQGKIEGGIYCRIWKDNKVFSELTLKVKI